MERSWYRRAACRGLDADLFFQNDADSQQRACEVCGRCTVREQCLAEARANEPTWECWGVRGGLTAVERKRTA